MNCGWTVNLTILPTHVFAGELSFFFNRRVSEWNLQKEKKVVKSKQFKLDLAACRWNHEWTSHEWMKFQKKKRSQRNLDRTNRSIGVLHCIVLLVRTHVACGTSIGLNGRLHNVCRFSVVLVKLEPGQLWQKSTLQHGNKLTRAWDTFWRPVVQTVAVCINNHGI
jgi:hypothetical protein